MKQKLLQNIHQQYERRIHDLDYLQWMQQNSARYIAGICILALLLSSTVFLRTEKPSRLLQPTAQIQAETDRQNDVMTSIGATETVVDHQQQEESLDIVQELSTTDLGKKLLASCNPLCLLGYQAPSNGQLVYSYGLGYDQVYEDYRYHEEICYDKGDGTVYACIAGIVQTIQLDQQWQVGIHTGEGLIRYSGLQECHRNVGDSVAAGDLIGFTGDKLYIQALR